MNKENYINLDNQMKLFSRGVYKKNKNILPENSQYILSLDDKNSGFYGEAFLYDDKIIIAIRGTNEILKDLLITDVLQMGREKIPNQFKYAVELYNQVKYYCQKNNLTEKEIIITGHSLGGSLAQLLGYFTGCQTVTFNAYGAADMLANADLIRLDSIKKTIAIRNYGNINDLVFYGNITQHIGQVFIIDTNSSAEKLSIVKYHPIQNMGNLEDAVEYDRNLHNKFGHFHLQDTIFKKIDAFFRNSKLMYLEVLNSLYKTEQFVEKTVSGLFSKDHQFIKETLKHVPRPKIHLMYNHHDVSETFKPFIKSIKYEDFLEDRYDSLVIEMSDPDGRFD
ncbi:hypothetical protein IJ732_01555, partial [bacterium]|nr:hypothetical protein [bacterium]